MQGNWYHLVGLIIIVGFSVISWLYRQLKEQSEKKRAKDMMVERQREMLRTGRDPGEQQTQMGPVGSEEDQRRREIATRREAQLAELRRRAQMRQQQGDRPIAPPPILSGPATTSSPSPPPVPRTRPMSAPLGSSGTTVPQRASMGPTPAPPARPSRTPVRPPQRAKPVKQFKIAKAPAPPPEIEGESSTHRLVLEEASPRRTAVVIMGTPSTPEEWRRAIIVNEILAPPLSMRDGLAPSPF